KVGDVEVVSETWIEKSWAPRTRSIHNDDEYGYSWFITRMDEKPVYYAWGFGGQMIYVVPEVGLTVVMTSDENRPSASNGYRDKLQDLMTSIVQAVSQASATSRDEGQEHEAPEDEGEPDESPRPESAGDGVTKATGA